MTDITDFTTLDLEGDGVFDQMMKAVELHLVSEYQASRIRSPEYATVYLGSLQAVMDRALQYLLQKEKADKEVELISEQIVTEGLNQDLLRQQLTNLQAEEQVLIGQKCKLDAEFDLLQEQRSKVGAETALLTQKKVTEEAQTMEGKASPESVIGRQMDLFKAQTDGFKRDAEQKAAGILTRTWEMRRTTDYNTTPANERNKLSDDHVGQAIGKLLEGVGIDPL